MAIKILIGGSPCTHWSIAQKKNRETEPSGIGWELFVNYLIAKEKFKPDIFLYENNKSASQAIKDEIKKRLGVWDGTLFMQDSGARYIEINSALVSAQNRQRFYVHNCGEVDQPKDRGILLRDILESGVVDREKAHCLKHQAGNTRDYFKKHHTQVAYEPVLFQCPRGKNCGGVKYDKSPTLTASYWQQNVKCIQPVFPVAQPIAPIYVGEQPGHNGQYRNGNQASKQYRVYSFEGKSCTICGAGGGGGAKTGLYAIPINPLVSQKNRCVTCGYANKGVKHILESNYSDNPSKQTWDSVAVPVICSKRQMIAEPIGVTENGKAQTIKAQYSFTSIPNICCYNSTYGASGVAMLTNEQPSEQFMGNGKDSNAMKRVYEVKDGYITIKGKQYPIKLQDGLYIIRKLSVTECCRLQTLPDDYCKAVSETQAYKGLGNGWTAEVIIHILNGALKDVPRDTELIVCSMYDGIGTGRYCLDKMGFTNVKYYAYEIDKYPIKIAKDNYPDIIECGDAYAVRMDDWSVGKVLENAK